MSILNYFRRSTEPLLVQTKQSDTKRDKIALSVASCEVRAINDDRYGKRGYFFVIKGRYTCTCTVLNSHVVMEIAF